ncbi:MAG: amino acid permease [Actinobacteria bacterium]|nr:amino acid permease [Actinomycetota bacterium]
MTKDRPTLTPPETELSRSLSEFDITMIGVGAMIGAGIFVLTGIAAGTTGPSLMLVFALNGLVTIFTAMVYAELGSAIPEAGGGYLWVKDALGRSQSFLAGWMSWFSHSVAGSLYALGFGSFANLLIERAGVDLPHLLFIGADKWIGVLIALVFLAINFRGASETGLAGNVVTVAKLLVIGLFIGFGLWAMATNPAQSADRFEPLFPQGYGNVFLAMGITFIAFEGYEIIVQAGEEVRDPRRSIPRAVFKSLLIVIPIYVLVAVTAIGAVQPVGGVPTWQFLGEAGELGLALAAERFMPLGTYVILAGGLLSTVSALNATTYSSTRVSFAMGRDRVLPDAFARIHDRFRTPYIALAATGALIIFMVLAIPIEDVAAAADVMFLLLFIQVNYAVIRIRGEFGDRLEYGYLMPFYPWVPIIGIVSNAFLAVYLYRFSPIAWFFAAVWIAVGFGVFVAYARTRVEADERPAVTFEEKAGLRGGRKILACVAKPEHVETVVSIAAAIARQRDAEVVVLNVVRVPPQLPMSEGRRYTAEAQPVVEAVHAVNERIGDVTISTMVGIGRRISHVINDIAAREEAELIVLGWRGTVHEGRVRGSVAQGVLRSADVDVAVVKDHGMPGRVDSVLVAVSPGIRQSDTLEYGAHLAMGFDADLRLTTVVDPQATQQDRITTWLESLREDVTGDILASEKVSTDCVEGGSVVDALAVETAHHSLLVLGSSRDWVLRRTLLGEFADTMANRSQRTVVMVHKVESRSISILRQVVGLLTRRRPDRPRQAREP